jgi:hypothetical protein
VNLITCLDPNLQRAAEERRPDDTAVEMFAWKRPASPGSVNEVFMIAKDDKVKSHRIRDF